MKSNIQQQNKRKWRKKWNYQLRGKLSTDVLD